MGYTIKTVINKMKSFSVEEMEGFKAMYGYTDEYIDSLSWRRDPLFMRRVAHFFTDEKAEELTIKSEAELLVYDFEHIAGYSHYEASIAARNVLEEEERLMH